jgi:hypothetical protein
MIDRYLLHTREHQAQLRLDAIQQRLIAQARQSTATQKRTSRTASRVVGFLHSARTLLPWRLGDVPSAWSGLGGESCSQGQVTRLFR